MLTSCEKEVYIKTPPFEPKVVLNSSSRINDTINVTVARTLSVQEMQYSTEARLADATVKLYVDDVYKETLEFDMSTVTYRSHTIAEAGKKYKLMVDAQGYKEVTAEVVAPLLIPISSISHIANARIDQDGNPQDELKITFTDPAADGDCYIVKVIPAGDSISQYYSRRNGFCVNTTDPGTETVANDNVDINTCLFNDDIFIRDILFNGKQKDLILYMSPHDIAPGVTDFSDSTYAYVELVHVPETFFKYEKSYRVAKQTNDNPFAEPVNVYSNVKNGYGIFTISNSDRKYLK